MNQGPKRKRKKKPSELESVLRELEASQSEEATSQGVDDAIEHYERSQRAGRLAGIRALFVVALVVGAIVLFYQASSWRTAQGTAEAPVDRRSMAWTMAQSFVEKELKSPGSAEYGSVFGGDYQNYEKQVEIVGTNRFRVSGWVDAQNDFGAKVRNRFAVTLQYDGSETWTAVEGPTLSPW